MLVTRNAQGQMFAHAPEATTEFFNLQADFQMLMLEASDGIDRERAADMYAALGIEFIEAGIGRHSIEFRALDRALQVIESTIPAVSLRKPVSLAKRRIPNVDTALRSGLPVGAPVTGAPVARDASGRPITF